MVLAGAAFVAFAGLRILPLPALLPAASAGRLTEPTTPAVAATTTSETDPQPPPPPPPPPLAVYGLTDAILPSSHTPIDRQRQGGSDGSAETSASRAVAPLPVWDRRTRAPPITVDASAYPTEERERGGGGATTKRQTTTETTTASEVTTAPADGEGPTVEEAKQASLTTLLVFLTLSVLVEFCLLLLALLRRSRFRFRGRRRPSSTEEPAPKEDQPAAATTTTAAAAAAAAAAERHGGDPWLLEPLRPEGLFTPGWDDDDGFELRLDPRYLPGSAGGRSGPPAEPNRLGPERSPSPPSAAYSA